MAEGSLESVNLFLEFLLRFPLLGELHPGSLIFPHGLEAAPPTLMRCGKVEIIILFAANGEAEFLHRLFILSFQMEDVSQV